MSDRPSIRVIGAEDIRASLPMRDAIDAVRRALALVDANAQPPRSSPPLVGGQFLLMPSELGSFAGCKVLTVADPQNVHAPHRIQGLMLLFDSSSLSPTAVLDGAALTSLRTPAVSAAMADLVTPDDASSLAVFGTGPQARRHVEALAAIRPLSRIHVIGRTPDRGARAAATWRGEGIEAVAAAPGIAAECDIVLCATTATEPLLTSGDVASRATVIAIGSHEPHRRELPGGLLERSQVIVEGRAVATAEAGDVIMAIAEGHLHEDQLITIRAIASGATSVNFDSPRVVKTCGMAWQDLVIAAAVSTRLDTHAPEADR
ncbi:ornithine cyclodeaminase family protein [Agromyces mangrovi Wang et al. 2018]|uniref:ornithine cyclodeaminase family protein n=1 Tax=Agromyces mangrovi TaxID=1858653 RepID=UPI0025727CB5|nr:ornithine cyclodeaminase family protein [Agromyces mangrovi]